MTAGNVDFPVLDGMCPQCGKAGELVGRRSGWTWTPHRPVLCTTCGWKGYEHKRRVFACRDPEWDWIKEDKRRADAQDMMRDYIDEREDDL